MPCAIRDVSYRVFGSERHRYRLTPVTPEDLKAFEDELGLALPHEYRIHLSEVGHGAGPYYGLFSPADVLDTLHEFDIELAEEGRQKPGPKSDISVFTA